MIQEVKYRGISSTPSEYECQDGELLSSIGLISEGEDLVPIGEPYTVAQIPSGYSVVLVHEMSSIKNLILKKSDGGLYWSGIQAKSPRLLKVFQPNGIRDVSHIGRTIVVLSDDGIDYFIWKSESEDYLYLGGRLPEIPISFGLNADMSNGHEVYIHNMPNIPYSDGTNPIDIHEEHGKYISNYVLGAVNKFISEEINDKGRFIYPFFIRWALRLYDGTLTKHSAPILLVPNTGVSPRIGTQLSIDSSRKWIIAFHRPDIHAVFAVPVMFVSSDLSNDDLDRWRDIVSSVDIFVSEPIYTYDQNGICSQIRREHDDSEYGIYSRSMISSSNVPGWSDHVDIPLGKYRKNPYNGWWKNGLISLELPSISKDVIDNRIKSTSRFYHISSIPLLEIRSGMNKVISIGSGVLSSLTSRELMSDDYDSHDTISCKHSFVYNGRLNICGIEKKPFSGFKLHEALCYTDSFASSVSNLFSTQTCRVLVLIKHEGRTIVVRTEQHRFNKDEPLLYFYYPNPNAYMAYVVYEGGYVELPLKRHEFLNGAYYFCGMNDGIALNKIGSPSTKEYPNLLSIVSEIKLPMLNKIYTSEVNNPFSFPLNGINTVGYGEIFGISAATKAISEGQFGQFPLYAFTSDGVWALEVSSTGTYSARQPVSRDVCINPDSITQMDNAVLFASDRGIMILSGATSTCMTEVLEIGQQSNGIVLPMMDKVFSLSGVDASSFRVRPFREFLYKCRMLYDYVGQRVIVYSFDAGGAPIPYSYVYSMKSRRWGMMLSNISGSIPSYPEALAMLSTGDFVDFSKRSAPSLDGFKGLVITRAMKLGMPDVHKGISSIIQRGVISRDSVKCVLYGSNDLSNWAVVSSSSDIYLRGIRGTPYKYYRLALMCNLKNGESLSGCTIEMQPRHTNKIR